MKLKKKVICIILTLILILCCLCACIPDNIKEEDIYLSARSSHSNVNIIIGRYKIASFRQEWSYTIYTLKSNDKDGFLDLFRKNNCFAGEFAIPNCMAFERSRYGLRIGQKAIWLASKGDIWVVQSTSPKHVYAVFTDDVYISNDDESMRVNVSQSLFVSSQNRYQCGVEYATPFSWSQFKSFYNGNAIDEEEKSIVIDCQCKEPDKFIFNKSANTKLYYNEVDNTFSVSNTVIEDSEE